MQKALAALRVSTTKQYDTGDSPEEQLSSIKYRAQAMGYEIINYKEFAQSANSKVLFHNQPMKLMVDWATENYPDIEYIMVKNIDRITRAGSGMYNQITDYAKSKGKKFLDAEQVISNKTNNVIEHLGIKKVFDWSIENTSKVTEEAKANEAKAERDKILRRLIPAQMRYSTLGYPIHPAIFGYISKRVETEEHGNRYYWYPHDTESIWIVKAYELRNEGILNDKEIVNVINSMGYKSRVRKKRDSNGKHTGFIGGKKLTVKQLQDIIANPSYAGVNTEEWLEGQYRKFVFPGLVSIESFNNANRGKIALQVQEDGLHVSVLKDLPPNWQLKKNKQNPEYPFKNYILCPLCKKQLLGSQSRGKSGIYYPAYHCNRKHYFRRNKKIVHELIEKTVKNLSFSESFILEFRTVLLEEWEKKRIEINKESIELNKHILNLEKEKQLIFKKIPILENIEMIRALEKNIEELNKDIALSQIQLSKVETTELDTQKVIDRTNYFMEHLDELVLGSQDALVNGYMFGLLFEELPTYSELENGTPKLSPLFNLNGSFKQTKSLKVSREGLEPPTNKV